MKITGKQGRLAFVLGAFFLTACADTAVGPEIEPMLAMGAVASGGVDAAAADAGRVLVEWNAPLTEDVSTSKYCPAKQRCSIELRDINVFATIPRGALTTGTTITVTALAGQYVNLEFGPHGTQFAKEIKVTVSASDTNVSGKMDLTALYWGQDEFGNAVVLEELPAKLFRGRIEFYPSHFSGYAIAM